MPVHTVRRMRPAIEIARQGRILLIDERDEELGRLGALLEADGHRVRRCGSYAEAVERLTDERYDVVMVAESVGDGEAGEVAEWARAVDPRLPVVMLLSRANRDAREDGWSGDISAYALSPVSAVEERQLKETVRRCLEPRVALVISVENPS